MKRLLQSFTSIAILFFSFNANSAIVYNDIADQTLAGGGTLDINFDGAGGPEFTFEDMGWGGAVEPYIGFDANAGFVMIGDFQTGGWDEIAGLAQGTTIDANSNFANNGVDGFLDPAWAAIPFGTGDQYIGAQFDLGGNNHFGWILVNWDANGTLIVKSFAYEDTPDASINAGDTGSGGGGAVLVTSITVGGQGGASTITTPAGTLQMSVAVLPANADDNTVTWSVQNGTGSATISASGVLTAVSDGVVTVTATANDGSGVTGSTDVTISNQSAGLNTLDAVELTVAPNPASNWVNVSSDAIISTIEVISLNGTIILAKSIDAKSGNLNIQNLTEGSYLLSVATENGLIIRRLSKN